MITREEILKALRDSLEPLNYVHAMWEGGAISFNRVDEWSDIDLQVMGDDEHTADIVNVVEDTLRHLAPIELRYELPQPSWHGHWQAFYRLKNTSPFLMIDFVVMKLSNPNRLLQTAIHGDAFVHFDKSNIVVSPELDVEAHLQQIRGRMETLRVQFPLFQILTLKEINRKNGIEAISFYQNFTLRPLVEMLRTKYDPTRYNFHTRYLYYLLSENDLVRLESLYFIANLDDLQSKFPDAQQFFWETIETIDLEDVRQKLEAAVVK